MSIKLKWLGHGGWSIQTSKSQILVDPFVSECPIAKDKVDDLTADFILVSHGHFDHIADVPSIAKRTGACVVANYEITQWLQNEYGLKHHVGMNIGGGVMMPFGHLKMTLAFHSSQLPDGGYGGEAGGFLLSIEDKKLYFACDTALFGDMALIGRAGIDVAVLPIGDVFTMGLADSIDAVRLIKPKQVLPSHYDTWPPIHQDTAVWTDLIREHTQAEPIVLYPGEVHVV